MTELTYEQVEQLLKGINPLRVSKKDNQSHLEAYDVRAHLTRLFGFGGWSVETTDLTMLYEESKPHEKPDQPPRWRAAYRATVHLTIHATGAAYTGAAVGTNWGWLPDTKRDETHDFAIKMAESQALKRAAINLGDQFGLSLYNDGSVKPLIGRTLVMPDDAPEPDENVGEAQPVDAHVDEQLAPEAHEAPVPQADPERSGTPAGQAADFDAEKFIADLTEKALNIPESVKRPRAHLLSLQMDASKHDLLKALTYVGEDKVAVPFNEFILQRMEQVAS